LQELNISATALATSVQHSLCLCLSLPLQHAGAVAGASSLPTTICACCVSERSEDTGAKRSEVDSSEQLLHTPQESVASVAAYATGVAAYATGVCGLLPLLLVLYVELMAPDTREEE
jgi:hypothetical protein